jgi:hypothetical protein
VAQRLRERGVALADAHVGGDGALRTPGFLAPRLRVRLGEAHEPSSALVVELEA